MGVRRKACLDKKINKVSDRLVYRTPLDYTHTCPICNGNVVRWAGTIEDTDWYCGSCWEDLRNCWLIEDTAWADLKPNNYKWDTPAWYNISPNEFKDEDWSCCIACGRKNGNCTSFAMMDHDYIAFGDVIDLDEQTGNLIYARGDHTMSAEKFYLIDKASPNTQGETLPPLDCRSCEWYQTEKCVPLRNVIDEYDGIWKQVKDPVSLAESYHIKPCVNYQTSQMAGWDTLSDLNDWIDAFEEYYRIVPIHGLAEKMEKVWGVNCFTSFPELNLATGIKQARKALNITEKKIKQES